MVAELIVNNIIGSLKLTEELFARFNCLMAQIAGAVKYLVDIEVHLKQPAQEGAEAPEKWFPEGILLHALLSRFKVKVIASVGWIY